MAAYLDTTYIHCVRKGFAYFCIYLCICLWFLGFTLPPRDVTGTPRLWMVPSGSRTLGHNHAPLRAGLGNAFPLSLSLSLCFLCLSLYVYKSVLSPVRLCDPMDCSPPGSSVHGTSPSRILEWVPISFSKGSSLFRDWTHRSYVSCSGGWILYHWAT